MIKNSSFKDCREILKTKDIIGILPEHIDLDSVYTDPIATYTPQYYYLTKEAKDCQLVATEGIRDMCERLECHFVLDLLADLDPRQLKDTFYVVNGVKGEDGRFYLLLHEENVTLEFSTIEYSTTGVKSDIKKNLNLYLARSYDLWVLMLPSEYFGGPYDRLLHQN